MKIEDVSLRIIQIESNLQPAPDSHHLILSHDLEAHATVQWFQTSFLPHSNCHNSLAKFPPYLSISGLLPVFFHDFTIENLWKWLGWKFRFQAIFSNHFHICSSTFSYMFIYFPQVPQPFAMAIPLPSWQRHRHQGATGLPWSPRSVSWITHCFWPSGRSPAHKARAKQASAGDLWQELVRETENLWETSLGYPDKPWICLIWCRIWVLWGMYQESMDWFCWENHNWLVVDLPLWKIWKSVGMIIPNIWKISVNGVV